MKPDIGDCVYVLYHKRWGKTLIDGQLKSKVWWEKRLKDLIEAPTVEMSKENLYDGKPAEETPIPYEKEYKLGEKIQESSQEIPKNEN